MGTGDYQLLTVPKSVPAEAADAPGVQDFELSAAELGGEVLQLRLVKFSRVNCLTIFVESNQGDEETTVIQKIALIGAAGDKFDVGALKDISKEQE